MNIITKEEVNGRLKDGIQTIFDLPDEEFKFLIDTLKGDKIPQQEKVYYRPESLKFFYTTDKAEAEDNVVQLGIERKWDENKNYIARAYFGVEQFSMHQILEECEAILENFQPNSKEYNRIKALLDSRNLESFKATNLDEEGNDKELLNKVFEILSSNDLLSKFLDYDNNKQAFSINGQVVPIGKYLEKMGSFFGDKDENGELSNTNMISEDFYIPNLEEIKSRYSTILDELNLDKYVNPYYTFERAGGFHEEIYREGREPDWNVSEELHDEIFKDMPENYTPEEKAIFIYCKMCSSLLYDEGYVYRDNLNKTNYGSTFSKEHLESIKPNSKITCYDFARIFQKFVNSLDDDITAVMIMQGYNEGHAYAGFYTDNVSATVEASNIFGKEGDHTNDFMKVKNGIKPRGIEAISDKKGLIDQAIDKVYAIMNYKKPKSIKDFVMEYKSISDAMEEQNNPVDISLKIEALLETMREKNISGNEFTQSFWGVSRTKFFGEKKLKQAYIGERVKGENGEERFKRYILIKKPSTEEVEEQNNDGEEPLYLIDTDTLTYEKCSTNEMNEKFRSGRFIYENSKHKMPGIDKEVEQ